MMKVNWWFGGVIEHNNAFKGIYYNLVNG